MTVDMPTTGNHSQDAPLYDKQPRNLQTWMTSVKHVSSHILLAGTFLVALEIAVRLEWVSRLIAPAPTEIISSFSSIIGSIFSGGFMLQHFLATFGAMVFGFLLALLFGIGFGVFITLFSPVRRYIYPYVVAFNATPRIAIAPVFLIWFGFGLTSKIILAASIATFPILINTVAGLSAADPQTLKLLRAFRATSHQEFWKVRVPMAMPYLFAGMQTGSVLAAVGAVVGEFTGGNRGLGYLILVAQEQINLSQMFALVVLLALNGLFLFYVVSGLRRKIVYWDTAERATLG